MIRMFKERLKIIEILQREPENIKKIILSNPKFKVEVELPGIFFEETSLEKKIMKGSELLFQITRERRKPDKWDIYAWGIPYLIKGKNGVQKIFISVGGLQCIITSLERKVKFDLMKKVYLMIKVL